MLLCKVNYNVYFLVNIRNNVLARDTVVMEKMVNYEKYGFTFFKVNQTST